MHGTLEGAHEGVVLPKSLKDTEAACMVDVYVPGCAVAVALPSQRHSAGIPTRLYR